MTAKERRERQLADNAIVERKYRESMSHHGIEYRERLYHCSAEMHFVDGAIYLKSYDTIVAAFVNDESTVYDFSRLVYGYTPTTAQHVRKFANYCKALTVITWKEVK